MNSLQNSLFRFLAISVITSTIPFQAYGFSEDLCYEDPDLGGYYNCQSPDYDPAAILKDKTVLFRNSVWDRIRANYKIAKMIGKQACTFGMTGYDANGTDGTPTKFSLRSMLHFDATFAIALMVGIPRDQAIQIAMYDEATDSIRYTPTDEFGRTLIPDFRVCEDLEPSKRPPACKFVTGKINLNRLTSKQYHSNLFHFVTPFKMEGATFAGITPNLADPQTIMLRNLTDWIYENAPLCIGGLSYKNVLETGSATPAEVAFIRRLPPAAQYKCFGSLSPKESRSYLIGNRPNFGFVPGDQSEMRSYLFEVAEQVISYEGPNNTPVLASEASKIVQSTDSNRIDGLKLGIYMHSLQDLVSHNKCADKSKMFRQEDGSFRVEYDPYNCAMFGVHMIRHQIEVGKLQAQVPDHEQTMMPALFATYDELLKYSKFRKFSRNGQVEDRVFRKKFVETLELALQVRDANDRVKEVRRSMLKFTLVNKQPLRMFPDRNLDPETNYIVNRTFLENHQTQHPDRGFKYLIEQSYPQDQYQSGQY